VSRARGYFLANEDGEGYAEYLQDRYSDADADRAAGYAEDAFERGWDQ
jgi:hypothetical protein